MVFIQTLMKLNRLSQIWFDDRQCVIVQSDTSLNVFDFHFRSQGFFKAGTCEIILL